MDIIKNKTISDKHEVGDIVFVSKEKDIWKLKQYPKVNGGIVAIRPTHWRCKGFSWRIQF